MSAICSRCGGSDNPRPLPKRYACKGCGSRLLCYGCDTTHNTWCTGRFGPSPDVPTLRGRGG